MTERLKKRGREHEVLPDFINGRRPKCLHAENTDRFLNLVQFDKTLADEEEEYAPSEELVNVVMRSLEEEIAGTSCTSGPSSNFGDNSAATNISSDHAGGTLASDSGIDLCYLLEASDGELGIPPSPFLNWKNEGYQSLKKTSEGLWESQDLETLGEKWHFVDDFENYQQFAVYEYEDPCDASQDHMNRDFVSQDMLFDADFSAARTLETAIGM